MELKKQKILIADDSKIDVEILCSILGCEDPEWPVKESAEYFIITADNGITALETVEKENPDIVLLDVMMPKATGFEVITKLKQSEKTRDIPVIFITNLSSAEDEEKGIRLGAVDYITKPFRPAVIKAKIKTHLEIMRKFNRVAEAGFTDALTGIPNRRFFDEKMSIEWVHAFREKLTVSLLMIDLDHFKVINDTYGHQQGDIVLQTVAKALTSILQRSTDFVARWGGEEFTVLLPSTEIDGAMEIAKKIHANIADISIPSIHDDRMLKVTVSIGVTSVKPSENNCMADLIRQVDTALYEAKNSGRNKICIFEE